MFTKISAVVLVVALGPSIAIAGGDASAASKSESPPPKYSGGDGLSCDRAVVVGTKSHVGGIASERAWVREHYPGARVVRQALLGSSDGKRNYDILTIEKADREKLDICFDITAFLK
jgi:hypothetical protein